MRHVDASERNIPIEGFHGTNVDDRDDKRQTALRLAAARGDETLVTLLIHHGADVRAMDYRGWDALYIAVSDGHDGVVELILAQISAR